MSIAILALLEYHKSMEKGSKIKIVCIVGPTAVGKSSFAVEYALEHNGEIISADSRQVYKGLDIGTGKITTEEMKGIPHHLLDVASPLTQFNVEQFRELAQKAIIAITSRGKLPIICGGTGFYIDSLVYNIAYPDVPHNEELRGSLEGKTPKELFEKLERIDYDFAQTLNNSEKNNRQRLVRFIELAYTLGKVPPRGKPETLYDVTWIGLRMSPECLRERIHRRLLDRIEQGMIKEAERLYKEGVTWKRMDELGLEYRYLAIHLKGHLTLKEMIQELEMEIWHYAKRQIVWFKRNKDIEWVEVK